MFASHPFLSRITEFSEACVSVFGSAHGEMETSIDGQAVASVLVPILDAGTVHVRFEFCGADVARMVADRQVAIDNGTACEWLPERTEMDVTYRFTPRGVGDVDTAADALCSAAMAAAARINVTEMYVETIEVRAPMLEGEMIGRRVEARLCELISSQTVCARDWAAHAAALFETAADLAEAITGERPRRAERP